MVQLTITPRDPLGNFLLPVSTTLNSAVLTVLVPDQGSAPVRSHSKHPIKLEAQTSRWSL